jgi:hypothetical protein
MQPMLTPEQRETVAGFTRTTQIIIFALMAGVTTYLAVAIAVRDPEGPAGQLPIAGVAMAVCCAIAALVLPPFLNNQQREAVAKGLDPRTGQPFAGNDAALVLGNWQVRKIIRGALLEGAAFFNIFVYQSGGPQYSLATAILLLMGLATLFPLRRLVEDWLDGELRTINELRQLRR